MELKTGGKRFAELKIQVDKLSPLLFVIAMMSLNHKLRKCTGRYELIKSQEKINHLMCMGNIKLFVKKKKKKKIGNPNRGSKSIQSGYRNGIWHIKMLHANNEKWETTHDGRNKIT